MLTNWIVFAVTMVILGGGLAYTIWEFQKPEKRPAKLKAGGRRRAREL